MQLSLFSASKAPANIKIKIEILCLKDLLVKGIKTGVWPMGSLGLFLWKTLYVYTGQELVPSIMDNRETPGEPGFLSAFGNSR